jgi:FKBP-type peptidyl-prolyl cis-trans isomerase
MDAHCSICKACGEVDCKSVILESNRNGYAKKILQEGDNQHFPKRGKKVLVHYTGMLMNGKQFDSSRAKGRPFSFVIGKKNVIQGWDEGVMTMSVGERALFVISPQWAYGESGIPSVIPPNATLVFDVELLEA